jgi:hypothetical protein
MLKTVKAAIERFLRARGLAETPLSDIMLAQLIFLVLSFCAGMLTLWFSPWLICFFIGAAAFSFNAWVAGLFAVAALRGRYADIAWGRHFLKFFLRLLATGLILVLALRAGASPFALGGGVAAGVLALALAAFLHLRTRDISD